MHYYQFNIGDYRKDTIHLSRVEHSIYRDLIDWYYLEELPIPKETQSVIRRLRLDTEVDKTALKNVLNDFFVESSDGYRQSRIDKEIAAYHANCEKNKQNGIKGGRPKGKKTQWVNSGLDLGTQSYPKANPNQEPLTINQEPLTKDKTTANALPPDGVSQSLWTDFKKLRAAKKAAITPTAMTGMAREADKAGISLSDALTMCCERGWVGFKAEWLSEKQGIRSINPVAKASPGKHTGFQNLDYKTGINEDGTFA